MNDLTLQEQINELSLSEGSIEVLRAVYLFINSEYEDAKSHPGVSLRTLNHYTRTLAHIENALEVWK